MLEIRRHWEAVLVVVLWSKACTHQGYTGTGEDGHVSVSAQAAVGKQVKEYRYWYHPHTDEVPTAT
jgi:hypothetical protein